MPRAEVMQRLYMVVGTAVFLLVSYLYLQNIGVLPGPNENPNPNPNDIPPKPTPPPGGGIKPIPGHAPWPWENPDNPKWPVSPK